MLNKYLDFKSNVYSYNIGPVHIEVVFKNNFGGEGDHYFYSINGIGINLLNEMKKAALRNDGLGSLCSRKDLPIRKHYEDRNCCYLGSQIVHWELYIPETTKINESNFIAIVINKRNRFVDVFDKIDDVNKFLLDENYQIYVCSNLTDKDNVFSYLKYLLTKQFVYSKFPMIIVNLPGASL